MALGFSLFTLRSIILAFALDVTPPEIGGSTVSYVFTWNQTVAVLSPLVGGFLADAFGIEFALYFIAFLIFTGALFVSAIKPMQRQA